MDRENVRLMLSISVVSFKSRQFCMFSTYLPVASHDGLSRTQLGVGSAIGAGAGEGTGA